MRLPQLPVIVFAFIAACANAHAAPPSEIKPLDLGLTGISYWGGGFFADTAQSGGAWIEFEDGVWGSQVTAYNNPQFSADGMPLYLNPGKKLRLLMWPFNANQGNRPPSWPDRHLEGYGKVVVTWQGDADIRMNGGTYLQDESSGPSTGSLLNGRRVYRYTGAPMSFLTVQSINDSNPPSQLKVWLPDPANPQNQSLEGELFHPNLLARIAAMDPGALRFMDWLRTNQSPQRDWVDRRLPSHLVQSGLLNPRSPADGFAGNRSTGVAWEYAVLLANATGRDMWICVPHLATDEYILKLARLIRYGSDGVEPYTGPTANPVYPPLNDNLRVYLEFSNEIWSNGNSFPQGNWAQQQADLLGISKPAFNARQFARTWSLFQQVFGGHERIVRVAALWSGNDSYNAQLLNELASYGPTQSPAVTADVVSPATYFGNGIQNWAYDTATERRNSADPWFHTTEDFTSGSRTVPVSEGPGSFYWVGEAVDRHLGETFDEWTRRIFSGSVATGSGPDATAIGGGFSPNLRQQIIDAFGMSLPIVSYEGGPSLYTDALDRGDLRDDGITTFIEMLNRDPRMVEMIRIHLNQARANGLSAHGIFTDTGQWGKFGQWGTLEYPGQNPEESAKLVAFREWADDIAQIRPGGQALGAVPEFSTPSNLGAVPAGEPLAFDLVASGGDIAVDSAPAWSVIGSLLSPGLAIQPVAGDPWRLRLTGTPSQAGENYVFLRISDDDGDAAWRIFSFLVTGGPGTLVESDFRGTAPARNRPWTPAYALDARLTYSGWDIGAPNVSGGTAGAERGIRTYATDDRFTFSANQGTTAAESTLAAAIADDEYIHMTLTPQSGASLDLRGAVVRFTVVREDFGSARAFHLFSSIGGFGESAALYSTPSPAPTLSSTEYVVTLPNTAAYAAVTQPVQVRIYPTGNTYNSRLSFVGFKLIESNGPAENLAPVFAANPFTRPAAAVGLPYLGSLQNAAFDPNGDPLTFEKIDGPAWLSVSSGGQLSGTPGSADEGLNVFTLRASDPFGLSADAQMQIEVARIAAAPVITPGGGTFSGPVTVAISTVESGATIRYTLDGSTPTANHGQIDSGPFLLDASRTVRALAVVSGKTPSPVVAASLTVNIDPATRVYQQSGNADVVIEAENYTARVTNGDTVSFATSDTVTEYQGTGYVATPSVDSSTVQFNRAASVDYRIQFSTTGTYYAWVRMRAANSAANTVWAGWNGNRIGNPNRYFSTTNYNSWVWVRHPQSFNVSSTGEHTFSLRRRDNGSLIDKIVLTRNSGTNYLSAQAAPAALPFGKAATPVSQPAPGAYGGQVEVVFSSASTGAQIWFTTDGSAPTPQSGTLYTAPILLNSLGTTPFRAVAQTAGSALSAEFSTSYTVQPASNISLEQGIYTVGEDHALLSVRVRRSGDPIGVATVNYRTADGTATAGEDYGSVSGTLTWEDGDADEQTIAIPIIDDEIFFEGDESFFLILEDFEGSAPGTFTTAEIIILDNDTNAPPVITLLDAAPLPATANAPVQLILAVEDDGPLELLNYQWSVLNEVDAGEFSDPVAPSPIVTFERDGVFTLEVTVSDGEHEVSETIAITVGAGAVANEAPELSLISPAIVGTIALPEGVTGLQLEALVTDDGLPSGAMTLLWEAVSGPAGAIFATPDAAASEVQFSAVGEYVLRLTASDGALESTLEVAVHVGGATEGGMPSDGLILHYTFDEGEGTGIGDSSSEGNDHTTTVPGATWSSEGRFGGAYGTNSASDVVGFVPAAQENLRFRAQGDAYTVSMWLRSESTDTFRYLFDRGPENLRLQTRSPLSNLRLISGGATLDFDVSTEEIVLNDGSWHLITVVNGLESGQWTTRLYINDGSVSRSINAGAQYLEAEAFFVGMRNNNAQRWPGLLDDFRIYNRALSAAEVSTLYAGAAGGEAPMIEVAVTGFLVAGQPMELEAVLTHFPALPEGQTRSLSWTHGGGPGTATFTEVSGPSTAVTFDTPGTQIVRLTVMDGGVSYFIDTAVEIQGNEAPVITLLRPLFDDGVFLPEGTMGLLVETEVADDGLPFGALNLQWSVASGAPGVTFAAPEAAVTAVVFPASGEYVLRLVASDGDLESTLDLPIAVGVTSGGSTPTAGLILHYTFDEGEGTVIGDSSTEGNDHTTTVAGATWSSEGRFGGAYGTNRVDAVTGFFPDNPSDLRFDPQADAYTVSLWVRSEATLNYRYFWHRGTDSALWITVNTSDTLGKRLQLFSGGSNAVYDGSTDGFYINDGEWHLVTVVNEHDGTSWRTRLYLDDSPSALEFASGTSFDESLAFAIGMRNDGFNRWPGLIDDFRIYNRAFLAAEVAALYAGGSGAPEGNQAPAISIAPTGPALANTPLLLTASVLDDGLPAIPGEVSTLWELIEGNGMAVFADPGMVSTEVVFDTAGTYVLRLRADDGAITSFAEVEVLVTEAVARGPQTFYIDDASGDDANDALSPATARRTFAAVAGAGLIPGDSVLFAAGQTFSENLFLDDTNPGTAAEPITLGSFGEGRATLDAGNGHGIFLYNVGGFVIRDLVIAGNGIGANQGHGIFLYTDVPGRRPAIRVENVDVSGFANQPGQRNGGIGMFVLSWREDNQVSGFEDVTVLDSVFHHNEIEGFSTWAHQMQGHHNLLIRGCTFHSIPGQMDYGDPSGSGLVIGRVDTALVEYCLAYNNGGSNGGIGSENGGVGIWTYDSNNVIIQHSISHSNRTLGADGGGFDLDGGVTDSTLQYNYSYDNDGAGYLLAQYSGAPPFGNNIVRYNISQNDGRRGNYGGIMLWAAQAGNRVRDVEIYNNTVFVTPSATYPDTTPSAFRMLGGNFTNINMRNNLFIADGSTLVRMIHADVANSTADVLFQGNAYHHRNRASANIRWGGTSYNGLATWRAAANGQEMLDGTPVGMEGDPVLVDDGLAPLLVDPGQLTSIEAYRLSAASPLRDTGLELTSAGFGSLDVGVRDFFNQPIPLGLALDIGAHEFQGPALTAYETWSAGIDWPDPSRSDPLASAMGDGIANLIKYALGMDPLIPGMQGALSHAAATREGSEVLSLTFTRPHPAPNDLAYTVEASSTLAPDSWAPVPDLVESITGSTATITAYDSVPIQSDHPRRFLRLRIELPTNP